MNEGGKASDVHGRSNAGPNGLPRCCSSCQLRSVCPLSLFLAVVGRAGRLSHFNKPQHHDVVFLSSAVVVGGGAIVGFSFFPFTGDDGPALIIPATTLSSTTSETDPFCPGRGLLNSKAARMLERMTRVANKMRSTLGFAKWLMIVKGPGSEDSDGSESASERPWTLSIAGSRTSIMIGERTEGEREGGEMEDGMETHRRKRTGGHLAISLTNNKSPLGFRRFVRRSKTG